MIRTSARIRSEPLPVELAGLAVLAIDEQGFIRESSAGADAMFLGGPGSLIGLPVARLIPRLGQAAASANARGPLAPHVAYLCNCGAPFRARRCDGQPFVCRLSVDEAAGGGCHLVVREVPPATTAKRMWCLE